MADNEKEEQNQNVEEEENEIEGDLIVEEGEDDELVKQKLYFNIMFEGIGY